MAKIIYDDMAKNALKSCIMTREHFEIFFLQMDKNALKLSTMVGENLRYSFLIWLKMH